MNRAKPKPPRAPPTPTPVAPSAAYIASTVDTYMAGIEAAQSPPPPPPRAKQKHKLRAAGAAAANGAQSPRKGNVCCNPFCGAKLSSAFAKFCARKSHCQLYRGLLLHCESFATEQERAVDVALEKLRATKRRKLSRSTSESESAAPSPVGAAAGAAAAKAAANDAFSIPKRKVPTSSPASAPSPAASKGAATTEGDTARRKLAKVQAAAAAEASGRGQTSSAAPAAAPADASSAPETPGGKKRRLSVALGASESGGSAPSSGASALAAPVRPPTPVGKVGGIEVIPLGAGRHATSFAGGSRYVQSGNRLATSEDLRAINPLSRPPPPPPTVSKPPTPMEAVAAALPPRNSSSSVDPRVPYRAPAWVDPRRVDAGGAGRSHPVVPRFEATPLSSPVLAQDGQASSGAASSAAARGRRISASEYLNSRKPQDPRLRPPQPHGGDPLGAVPPPGPSATLRRASSDLSTVARSAFSNGAPRTLSRTVSELSGQIGRSEASFRDPDLGFSRPTSSEYAASSGSRSASVPYNEPSFGRPPPPASSSSYEAAAYSRWEYDPREVSYRSDRAYSPERYHEYSYEPEYHRSSSSYTQERPEWQRRSEEPPRASYREQVPPPAAVVPPRAKDDYNERVGPQLRQQQQPPAALPQRSQQQLQAHSSVQRDASMLPEIPPVAFSSHDWFIVNLLSRVASFFPKALAPVLNKTKKPRKMRFYLDYADRVKELSGSRFSVDVTDGKGVVSLAGREWLSLKGSSTVKLYVEILETLLDQGNAWRKLVEDSHRVYGNGVKRLGDRADRSTAFVRLWQGMKYNAWDKFPTERQVTYFRGDTRHHWTFCVGNVEIGSGSHEEKREAYRLAAADAMRFLLSLEILSDNQNGSASGTIEIVDNPEMTVSRARDSSFGSDADGAFSPADRSAGDDDMDISDGDDARPPHRPPSASFDAMDLLRNGLPTHR
ncbi:hypothetical protein PybrP1_004670 [[Pythium] brassicae (nom. inval.)]|nr:hypothetical protein PybrP1_004670 [[Pythium] brassicae (nom. inval.)]